MHNYQDTRDEAVHTYGRVHGNGEQTHVVILSTGSDHYTAVAYDVDPGEFEPVAAECVAFDPTLEGCAERAKRWMERNPKGVAYQGGDAEKSGGGALAAIKRILGKLNEYGNSQVDQMQPPENQ